jgi:hypothetical protein
VPCVGMRLRALSGCLLCNVRFGSTSRMMFRAVKAHNRPLDSMLDAEDRRLTSHERHLLRLRRSLEWKLFRPWC